MSTYDHSHLEALWHVAREGSFERAGRALGVTSSAVSQRVKALETRLGHRLINRRPCGPTEVGMKLCRHFDEMNLLQHNLQAELRQEGVADTDAPLTIRVAVNADSLASWFPTVMLRAFSELNVRLDIAADDQSVTADRLKTGDALAAVTEERTPLPGFRRIPLGSLAYIPVAAPEFMERCFHEGVTLQALSRSPSIHYDRKDQIQMDWITQQFGETPSTLVPQWIPSYSGYIQCCLNGLGWGLVPLQNAVPHIQRGELVELMPSAPLKTQLYWQMGNRGGETMENLAQIVTEVAHGRLLQESRAAAKVIEKTCDALEPAE